MVVSFLFATMTFFVGNETAPLLGLFFLMILDVLTRWQAEGKLKADELKLDFWIGGFYCAWHEGTLNSKDMRKKFFRKAFTCMGIIILFNLA